MSKNAAKTAAGGSSVRGRTKHEQDQQQRKTVYRPVLDNPLSVSWPTLPAPVRRSILEHLVPVLNAPLGNAESAQSISQWRTEQHRLKRVKSQPRSKRIIDQEGPQPPAKKVKRSAPPGTELPTHDLSTRTTTYAIPDRAGASLVPSRPATSRRSPPPPLLDYLAIGINQVTRALESQIRWARWQLGDATSIPGYSQQNGLIPTDHARAAHTRKRVRKKSNPTAFTPATALKLDSIDYSTMPHYAFLSTAATSANESANPPYYLAPSTLHPCPRLLLNSETLRIKRALKRPAPTARPDSGRETEGEEDEDEQDEPMTVPLIDSVFVCKPDINPPSLVAHLPGMVAAANGVRQALSQQEAAEGTMQLDQPPQPRDYDRPRVRIIPLDQGAEKVLADALGLRRVAVIGISSLAPGMQDVLQLLENHLEPPTAPWLVPHLLNRPPAPTATTVTEPATVPQDHTDRFVETHIKHLKTSAPLNPKAKMVQRKQDKKLKKDQRKLEAQTKRNERLERLNGGRTKEAGAVYEAKDEDEDEYY
ncbi:uncharacterized protein JCM15063_003553 [Sporobolomyces koalae]|uniref:uncharacterized protein n=1 Tax=Sporobolomyces koalae TaxID=500713 RepID=UPI00317541C2